MVFGEECPLISVPPARPVLLGEVIGLQHPVCRGRGKKWAKSASGDGAARCSPVEERDILPTQMFECGSNSALPSSDASMSSQKPDGDTSLTLMLRLQKNPTDAAAWSEFVERYRPMIRAWCLKWGSQNSDADDVAQEVLVRLLKAMSKFEYDPTRSFRAWLKAITHNARNDFVTSRRSRSVETTNALDSIVDSNDALADLEEKMEDAFNHELIALAMLPDRAPRQADDMASFPDDRPGKPPRRRGRGGARHGDRPRLRRPAPSAKDAGRGSADPERGMKKV